MDKLVNSVLRKFPQEVSNIIHEYARDDSKKKEFLKTYARLYFVWKSINSIKGYQPSRKIIQLSSSEGNFCQYCIKVCRNNVVLESDTEHKMVYFMNIDSLVFFDETFRMSSSIQIPQSYMWEYRFV